VGTEVLEMIYMNLRLGTLWRNLHEAQPNVCVVLDTVLFHGTHISLTNARTLISTRLQGVIYQKSVILLFNAVRTSDLTGAEKHAYSLTNAECQLNFVSLLLKPETRGSVVD
jgi:hypothetical protein